LENLDLQELIKFNTFRDLCILIPDIEIPTNFKTFTQNHPFNGNLQICLQHCNYGPMGYGPIAKSIQNSFILIIYGVPASCLGFKIFTFDYLGMV
jgi:hypothetical protein